MYKKNIPFYDQNKEYESLLHQYRVDRGLTIFELSKKAKVSVNEIATLANGSMSPLYERGKGIKDCVIRICTILNTTPAELFPRYICDINRYNGGDNDLVPYETYSEKISKSADSLFQTVNDLASIIKEAALSKREKIFLYLYFYFAFTYEDIGDKFKISRERVRQSLDKTLRKLRFAAHRLGYTFKYENKA